jgi:PIN domain nuclease of toxin-antitoxin system
VIAAIADTHAAIWFLHADSRLSAVARGFIERSAATGNNVGVSTITLAEIVYLSGKGRVPAKTLEGLGRVVSDPEDVPLEIPVGRPIVEAMQRVNPIQVPDLPNRLIATTALHFNVPVISRDRRIQCAEVETIW